MSEPRKIRLRPETIARLEAVAAAMGLSTPDELAEQIIEEALPSPHHADLIGDVVGVAHERAIWMIDIERNQ